MVILPVNGTDVDIFVDTGASNTIVPRSISIRYGWEIFQCDRNMVAVMTISRRGTKRLAEPFYVNLRVKIDKWQYDHVAWDRTEPNETFLVLGCDFLDYKNLVLHF